MGTTTCIFQQFNPSTLKAIYNPSTGKAQCVKYEMSCEHCADGKMPYALNIAFSNFVDVDCCYISDYRSDKFVGVADALNGNTYKIYFLSECIYSTPIAPADKCGLEQDGDFGVWSYYSDGACNNFAASSAFKKLFIQIKLTATGLDVIVDVGHGSEMLPCYHQYGLFCGSAICSCEGINETVTNDITGCYDTVCVPNDPPPGTKGQHPCGSSGQLQITGLYC